MSEWLKKAYNKILTSVRFNLFLKPGQGVGTKCNAVLPIPGDLVSLFNGVTI